MLREFVEKKHFLFARSAADWQEAVRMSCRAFIQDGTVDPLYAEEIINSVKEYGPYIVLFPGVAMPHAQQTEDLVFGTGVSFMKLEEPVSFDDADPDKQADLFFTLAAKDPGQHLRNMKELVELLECTGLVGELHGAHDETDLVRLADKYGM